MVVAGVIEMEAGQCPDGWKRFSNVGEKIRKMISKTADIVKQKRDSLRAAGMRRILQFGPLRDEIHDGTRTVPFAEDGLSSLKLIIRFQKNE